MGRFAGYLRRQGILHDALDESGQRFWLFRVLALLPDGRETVRWFLHGRFA